MTRTATEFLAEAERDHARLGLPRVVDCDRHLAEPTREIAAFMDEPWRRIVGRVVSGESYIFPTDLGGEQVGVRVERLADLTPEEVNRALGIDAYLVLPTRMLSLGLNPNPDLEAGIARGYCRWLLEAYLPEHPGAYALPYLPFRAPEAAAGLVREFGDHPRVAGFLCTTARYETIHRNEFLPVYAELEARDLPLAFHPTSVWREQPVEMFNQFGSAAAIGMPLFNTIHLVNLLTHGIPERFPRLRFIFYECGVAWVPFVMYRIDSEYTKRPNEAPLLTRRPSEYVRERCFFSTQPLDSVGQSAHLEALMRTVGCSQLLFGSNFPRWDFDLPARLANLPFLSEGERADLLAGNAARVFRLG